MFFQAHEKRDIRQRVFLPAAGCPFRFLSWSGAYLAPMALNPFGIGLSRMIL